MIRMQIVAGSLLVGMVLGCTGCELHDPPAAAAQPHAPAPAAVSAAAAAPVAPAPANGPTKFGAPLGPSPVVALSSILRDSSKYAKTKVKTEGKVTAVCQAAGCWMEIADATGEAHVRMNGHSFLVPKSASGRRAIVEGTVLAKPDNGECEQEAKEATGKIVKVELDATGVELL